MSWYFLQHKDREGDQKEGKWCRTLQGGVIRKWGRGGNGEGEENISAPYVFGKFSKCSCLWIVLTDTSQLTFSYQLTECQKSRAEIGSL